MDEDQLIAPPFEQPSPKRQTDTELIMARLKRIPWSSTWPRASKYFLLGTGNPSLAHLLAGEPRVRFAFAPSASQW